MKTTITAAERISLIGLLALAKTHDDQLRHIHVAACTLLGHEGEEMGHIQDAVYDASRRDVDGLLERLQITVGK